MQVNSYFFSKGYVMLSRQNLVREAKLAIASHCFVLFSVGDFSGEIIFSTPCAKGQQ